MFESYRVRPVVEWEGSDESRELEVFNTLTEAVKAKANLLFVDPNPDFEPRVFWTLYGINPEVDGVRTEEAIADRDSEGAAIELLTKLIGPLAESGNRSDARRFTARPVHPQNNGDAKPHKVRMVWESGIAGDKPTKDYEFSTLAELNAFLKGCEEANGWLDMKQIDPGPDGTFPDSDENDAT